MPACLCLPACAQLQLTVVTLLPLVFCLVCLPPCFYLLAACPPTALLPCLMVMTVGTDSGDIVPQPQCPSLPLIEPCVPSYPTPHCPCPHPYLLIPPHVTPCLTCLVPYLALCLPACLHWWTDAPYPLPLIGMDVWTYYAVPVWVGFPVVAVCVVSGDTLFSALLFLLLQLPHTPTLLAQRLPPGWDCPQLCVPCALFCAHCQLLLLALSLPVPSALPRTFGQGCSASLARMRPMPALCPAPCASDLLCCGWCGCVLLNTPYSVPATLLCPALPHYCITLVVCPLLFYYLLLLVDYLVTLPMGAFIASTLCILLPHLIPQCPLLLHFSGTLLVDGLGLGWGGAR